METKHTQGEWLHVIEKEGININDVVKHNNQYIATIHVTGTTEEWKSNAKLIAAAPDLLEALERLYSFNLDSAGKYLDIILNQCEAAIKKATE